MADSRSGAGNALSSSHTYQIKKKLSENMMVLLNGLSQLEETPMANMETI